MGVASTHEVAPAPISLWNLTPSWLRCKAKVARSRLDCGVLSLLMHLLLVLFAHHYGWTNDSNFDRHSPPPRALANMNQTRCNSHLRKNLLAQLAFANPITYLHHGDYMSFACALGTYLVVLCMLLLPQSAYQAIRRQLVIVLRIFKVMGAVTVVTAHPPSNAGWPSRVASYWTWQRGMLGPGFLGLLAATSAKVPQPQQHYLCLIEVTLNLLTMALAYIRLEHPLEFAPHSVLSIIMLNYAIPCVSADLDSPATEKPSQQQVHSLIRAPSGYIRSAQKAFLESYSQQLCDLGGSEPDCHALQTLRSTETQTSWPLQFLPASKLPDGTEVGWVRLDDVSSTPSLKGLDRVLTPAAPQARLAQSDRAIRLPSASAGASAASALVKSHRTTSVSAQQAQMLQAPSVASMSTSLPSIPEASPLTDDNATETASVCTSGVTYPSNITGTPVKFCTTSAAVAAAVEQLQAKAAATACQFCHAHALQFSAATSAVSGADTDPATASRLGTRPTCYSAADRQVTGSVHTTSAPSQSKSGRRISGTSTASSRTSCITNAGDSLAPSGFTEEIARAHAIKMSARQSCIPLARTQAYTPWSQQKVLSVKVNKVDHISYATDLADAKALLASRLQRQASRLSPCTASPSLNVKHACINGGMHLLFVMHDKNSAEPDSATTACFTQNDLQHIEISSVSGLRDAKSRASADADSAIATLLSHKQPPSARGVVSLQVLSSYGQQVARFDSN